MKSCLSTHQNVCQTNFIGQIQSTNEINFIIGSLSKRRRAPPKASLFVFLPSCNSFEVDGRAVFYSTVVHPITLSWTSSEYVQKGKTLPNANCIDSDSSDHVLRLFGSSSPRYSYATLMSFDASAYSGEGSLFNILSNF